MNKHNVVYACSRVLLSLKEEGNSDTCDKMDIMLTKISQSWEDKYCMIQFI